MCCCLNKNEIKASNFPFGLFTESKLKTKTYTFMLKKVNY